MSECCEINEDGYSLGHTHADGEMFACKPERCPGCMLCPREEADE